MNKQKLSKQDVGKSVGFSLSRFSLEKQDVKVLDAEENKVLEESLFSNWLEETGEAEQLDIPTEQIEKEVREIIRKSFVSSRLATEKRCLEILESESSKREGIVGEYIKVFAKRVENRLGV